MEKGSGRITVVVPVYHVEEKIMDTLARIRAQTWEDLTILLVENGSDKDRVYCRQAEEKYDNVRTVHGAEEINIGQARNLGLNDIADDYFLFFDADDEFPAEDTVERMYHELTEQGGDVLVANYSRRFGDQRIKAADHGFDRTTDTEAADFRFRGFFSGGHLAYAWGKLYRTSFVKKSGAFFPEVSYGEDKGFAIMLYAAGARYVFSDINAYVYVMNADSASYRYRSDYKENWVRVAREAQCCLSEGRAQRECQDLIDWTLLFALIFHGKQEYEKYNKISAIREIVEEYRRDSVTAEAFHRLRKNRKKSRISSFVWRTGTWALELLLGIGWNRLTALLLYSLFRMGMDKRYSSTGKKSRKTEYE